MDRADAVRIKDKVLEAILYSFADDDFLAQRIILQGGGALHFVYGSPRYSSDLDFVTDSFREITQYIPKEITVEEVTISPKATPLKDKRFYLRYEHPSGIVGKVEVYRIPAFDVQETQGRFSPLKTESPDEIYTDKLKAILSRFHLRKSIKPADLFDLNYLSDMFKSSCSTDQLKRKAQSYEEYTLLEPSLIREVGAYISDAANHNQFQKGIVKSLLPDVANHISLNEAYFKRAAEHLTRFI